MRALLWIGLAAAFTACAPHRARMHSSVPATTPSDAAAYIDLQPGWRLRVITPLTKSGSYLVSPKNEQRTEPASSGLAMTLSADRDFIGYQTAYYSVQPRARNGVHIVFVSAQDTKKGVTISQPRPRVMLFRLSQRAKYVRLVYLARVSRADHDMAVVAASTRELLESFTRSVQANPKACFDSEHTFCFWVPPGIAIQPQVARRVKDAIEWIPAR